MQAHREGGYVRCPPAAREGFKDALELPRAKTPVEVFKDALEVPRAKTAVEVFKDALEVPRAKTAIEVFNDALELPRANTLVEVFRDALELPGVTTPGGAFKDALELSRVKTSVALGALGQLTFCEGTGKWFCNATNTHTLALIWSPSPAQDKVHQCFVVRSLTSCVQRCWVSC